MDAEPTPAHHPAAHQPDPAAQAAGTPVDGTGHEAVDAALTRLDALGQLPLERHAGEFDAIHRALVAVLDMPPETQQART